MRRTSNSPEATVELGKTLGAHWSGGLAIGLVGPLGAGKTQFVKGLAEGNGLLDPRSVTSPTFTLVQEYPGRWWMYHIDVYRLGDSAAFRGLGFEEMIRTDSVAVVEWADRVREEMPEDTLWIEFAVIAENHRSLNLQAAGSLARKALECLLDASG